MRSQRRPDTRALLGEVLAHKWQEPLLRIVGQGHDRYTDIRSEVIANYGHSPGDWQITKELRRMQTTRLVRQRSMPGSSRKRWELTTRGVWLLGLLDHVDKSEDATEFSGSAVKVAEERNPRVGVDGVPIFGIDTGNPHPARRYDYWLGGKDNFPADRESGDALELVHPTARLSARENRDFLRRAVGVLAAAGIRQFLDIGTGLPTANNTHEVAQSIAPESRVVYVDNDPLVLAHARALLTSDPRGATAYIDADLRDPESILNHPALIGTLDLTQPVGLILVGVLHFISGNNAVKSLVDKLSNALPAGSFIAATHGTLDYCDADFQERYWEMFHRGGTDVWPRSRDEFSSLFNPRGLIEPGIVPAAEWRREAEDEVPSAADVSIWAAVSQIS